MLARTEVLGDGTIGREKALSVPRRFKPLHASLSLTGGLVGVLRTIIEIAMLAMFHPRKQKCQNSEGGLALNFCLCRHREEQREGAGRKLCRVRIVGPLQRRNKRTARR